MTLAKMPKFIDFYINTPKVLLVISHGGCERQNKGKAQVFKVILPKEKSFKLFNYKTLEKSHSQLRSRVLLKFKKTGNKDDPNSK